MTVPPPPQPELTRANRYTPGIRLQIVPTQTFLPVVKCRSCSSLVQDTDLDKDNHERLHPRISCNSMPAHVCMGMWHDNGHAWEEQFQ